MIAFDSCILIYVLEDSPDFANQARRVFLDIERTGGVCSTLVIAESLYGTIQSAGQLSPLQSDSIVVIPLDAKIAEHAGRLRSQFSLKTADAVHLATAVSAGADTFITNDLALCKIKIPGLNIQPLHASK